MKRGVFLTGLAVFILISGLRVSFAQGDFYVVPVPRGVGTPIGSVPYTVSSPGHYYLTTALVYSQTAGSAITIDADSVTLDLMGFSLTGPGQSSGSNHGITIRGRSNLKIRNGTVQGFGDYGIGTELVNNHNIEMLNLSVLSNGGTGILAYGAHNLVERCDISNNGGYGLHAYSICRILRNNVSGNGSRGIYVYGGCVIKENTAYDNDGDGIYCGDGCVVTGNSCYSNDGYGIRAGSGCTVNANSAAANTWSGILASYGSTITGNSAYLNSGHGIWAGRGATLTENAARVNGHDGIKLDGANLVNQNNATQNSGTNITACQDCTFGLNHTASY